MLLCYHNLLKIYYTIQTTDIIGHGRKGYDNEGETSGFAYVFYATADLYACSTLVNIQRLRTLNSTIPIHVLASEYLSIPYMDALEAANVTVHIEETPQLPSLLYSYYQDCLLKLLAFKMHKLDPSLKRVLIFDSDQFLLKHFDNLFTEIPSVDLAAARAYWLPGETVFSSAFMMINLSDRLWEKVNRTFNSEDDGLEAKVHGSADMDILNKELGDTAMILSGEYVTLNSHWEDWTIPNWFHPEDSPPPNRTISHVPRIPELKKEPPFEIQTDLKVQDKDQIHVAHSDLGPEPRHPEQSEMFQQLIQLHEYISIVHFTSLGKPWTYTVQEVIDERPDAHPLLAVQFGMWRKIAGEVCPDDWNVP